ncbi:pleckstrin homology domain-containing family N member 1 isoform X2 [Suncus etruscus]|uniref:pleckstrin homology domain-containing family N member 1 isoform X2 n=1 Tax=Suncus etruscus TaxID=109475 RepID=UPI002110B1BE|nr:pleckstrin homology domain-containing family N member 1 isoform X2 [Suncus etruscus]
MEATSHSRVGQDRPAGTEAGGDGPEHSPALAPPPSCPSLKHHGTPVLPVCLPAGGAAKSRTQTSAALRLPAPPTMGNSHCVPQAPRRLRASFSRKPSLKGVREDSARKLAGLLGKEASPDGDTAADKIFCYIPGTDIPGLQNQLETSEQPFLSIFRKSRRRVPVRTLGKVVHYAKVQLRFQNSQEASDCYLELFPAHLYFQAVGSEGLTFQGLLPLTELNVSPLEGTGEPAFQITGPLPAPLLVLCPSHEELSRWLYHLDKQMALSGGLRRCHSAPPQGPPEDELPWTLQRRLTRMRTLSGRHAGGSAICASRVKLQHLPSQEPCDRLLLLYPNSLAIFSEEPDGLCFKGELPLSAIHINLEEKDKQIRSFLIEGHLINSIRVLCATYEDYSRWLLCLQAVTGSQSFSGLRAPPQVGGSGRGSLSSDGRTSWDSGRPASPSIHTHSLPESTMPPPVSCPAQALPEPGSTSRHKAELRRGSSAHAPRSKARGERSGPVSPLHLDLTKLSVDSGLEAQDPSLETPQSPLYADPYTPPATSHHKITDVRGLDEFLSAMQSSLGTEPPGSFPSVPVSVPVSDPSCGPSKKGNLVSRAAPRHRGSLRGRVPPHPDSPKLVSPRGKEGLPPSTLPSSDGRPSRTHDHHLWDKAPSPSRQQWPRLNVPETEGGPLHWI